MVQSSSVFKNELTWFGRMLQSSPVLRNELTWFGRMIQFVLILCLLGWQGGERGVWEGDEIWHVQGAELGEGVVVTQDSF